MVNVCVSLFFTECHPNTYTDSLSLSLSLRTHLPQLCSILNYDALSSSHRRLRINDIFAFGGSQVSILGPLVTHFQSLRRVHCFTWASRVGFERELWFGHTYYLLRSEMPWQRTLRIRSVPPLQLYHLLPHFTFLSSISLLFYISVNCHILVLPLITLIFMLLILIHK